MLTQDNEELIYHTKITNNQFRAELNKIGAINMITEVNRKMTHSSIIKYLIKEIKLLIFQKDRTMKDIKKSKMIITSKDN